MVGTDWAPDRGIRDQGVRSEDEDEKILNSVIQIPGVMTSLPVLHACWAMTFMTFIDLFMRSCDQ